MICPACGTALDSRSTFCPTCGRTVDDPHIGQVIAGHYLIHKRIAIGGFGSIYRGEQTDVAAPVALKIMHRELAADDKLVARFRREGDVLITLRDRHTVATYEIGSTPEGLPFIAMELLEGETLLRLLQLHGRMPWNRVFGIARQMCSALGEAHALGVIHRDLKPGNIFLTNDDVVKVLDFGIAKILATSDMPSPQELTIMGTAVGTLEYMGPEQLMGGRADNRTDIYTVGVLAYELIVGKRPFNAVGLDLLTQQLTEAPPPPSSLVSVPHVVDDVLLRCLAHDTEDRFRDVHELAYALDAALATYRPEPPPPVFAEPAPRPAMPLPNERPVMRAEPTEKFPRDQMPRSAVVMLAIAMVLFVLGIGLVLAYLV